MKRPDTVTIFGPVTTIPKDTASKVLELFLTTCMGVLVPTMRNLRMTLRKTLMSQPMNTWILQVVRIFCGG